MRKHANMKPTLIPYASATVAYLLHGEWYTPADMAALQGDKRNMSRMHDAQANALPYTAAMLARREDRTSCKVLHVAIIGSRDYPDLQAVVNYVNSLPDNTVIVSGGAAGVDTAAKRAALTRWGESGYLEFPADWKTYGKSAGFRRNADIVNAADRVVAFWDGVSKGTAHSIGLARQAGKPVEVVTPCVKTEVVSFQDVKAHWNAAAQKWDDPRFVYIGRGNKSYNLPTSPYANPFKLASEAERPAIIAAYRDWLASRALDLEPLRGKVLVCWCKDKSHPDRACHGDVLVEALEGAA